MGEENNMLSIKGIIKMKVESLDDATRIVEMIVKGMNIDLIGTIHYPFNPGEHFSNIK